MSALSDHGIRHLSHSSIDLARICLALWVLRYLFGVRDPANAAMARGLAVELGCQIAHTGGEFDDPAEEALKEYNKRTALGVDGEARDKERANIKPMVEQYLSLFDGIRLRGFGKHSGHSLADTIGPNSVHSRYPLRQ